MTKQKVSNLIWASTFLVYFLPFVQWGSNLDWEADEISLLSLFPLLGMWAFAQMWLHYAIGAVKRRYPAEFDYKPWYKGTANVVLVLILLHPGILVFETVKAGLTPFDYVDDGSAIFLIIAYLALASFLLYEVAERMQKSVFWQKNFSAIKVLNVFAMLAIFAHSLKLGNNLEEGWLRFVWIAMFLAFVGLIIDSYKFKQTSKPKPQK